MRAAPVHVAEIQVLVIFKRLLRSHTWWFPALQYKLSLVHFDVKPSGEILIIVLNLME